jgi:protein-disulfide isomerase/TolA-binding protein
MRFTAIPLTLVILLFAITSFAQTTGRRTAGRPVPSSRAIPKPSPPPVAEPKATPASTRAPLPPKALVTVNGQTLTTADFDPALRQQLDSLEDKIREARQKVLELQINTTLLEVEAKKRRTTSQQLYDLEVTKKITEPTAAEIKKFLEENRDDFEGADAAEASRQVAVFLHGERETRLSDEFVRRLRITNQVVMGADINTPNLDPAVAVATIAGRPVPAGLLNERLKPILYNMRLSAYQIEKKKAEQLVDDLLLLAEANKRNVAPEEIIRGEISDKIHPPTEAEIAKFYSDNKARINGDLDSARNQLVTYLQDQEQQRLEKSLSERLRKTADIRWLISEPPQPVQAISVDDDPSRGDANAPVTLVEFTDFQCPACSAMQPVLEDVLRSYGNKVKFVVRDFPLSQHANARKAAEAADAANAQGKFFEYTALLFKRQNALDVPSLKKYASEVGLDRARFDAELDAGTYAAEVKHDIQDGEIYGIESTPTIFINGVMLRTLSEEALRAAIDHAAAGARTTTPPK